MDAFASTLTYWMTLEGQITATTTNSSPFRISILLHRDSLCRAFLTFSPFPFTLISALFPIDSAFSSTTIIGDTVLISFPAFTQNCLIFQCPTILSAQTLRTQITYCSHINRHSSSASPLFPTENSHFLSSNGCFLDPFPSPAPFLPLLPIISDPQSASTWRRRCETLNLPFVTRADPLSVIFFTWNVERRSPTSDLIPSLSFLFSSSSDLVVITLQEIDFSVWALVIGTSPQVQPWSQLFEDAGAAHGYKSVGEASLGGVLLKIMKSGTFPYPLTTEIVVSSVMQ
jgi:hypothetical protein